MNVEWRVSTSAHDPGDVNHGLRLGNLQRWILGAFRIADVLKSSRRVSIGDAVRLWFRRKFEGGWGTPISLGLCQGVFGFMHPVLENSCALKEMLQNLECPGPLCF